MKYVREWVAGIVASVSLLSFAGEGFRASGIVESVEADSVVLLVSSDNCSGSYRFYIKSPELMHFLREGRRIFFRASASPCEEEKVYLLEVRSGVYEEAEDVQGED